MELDYAHKHIRLSAGVFAGFQPSPGSSTEMRGQRWRAEAGNAWHQELQQRALAEHPKASKEIPVQGNIIAKGWTLQIHGRIDLLLPGKHGPVIQELKTVMHPLPMDDATLLQRHPAYVIQAACYQLLWNLKHGYADADAGTTPARAELVFIELASGIVQEVPLMDNAQERVMTQAELIAAFAEERSRRSQHLRQLNYQFPFTHLREGQGDAWEYLQRAANRYRMIAFQAPTGFGKTGLALSLMLERARKGEASRIIYLTSKATGQLQAMRQLEAMVGGRGTDSLRTVQLRSRRDHAKTCPVLSCPGTQGRHCRDNLSEQWEQAQPEPALCFAEGGLGLEQAREASARWQLCPYELTRYALPLAEVWVGDYNYLFSPQHSMLLENVFDYRPEHTCLIVDEAHNLPGRVAAALSQDWNQIQVDILGTELADLGAVTTFLRIWQAWARFLRELSPTEQLELNLEYEAASLIADLSEAIAHLPLDYDALSPEGNDALGTLIWTARALEDKRIEWYWHVHEPGQLSLRCLDASQWIAERLRNMGATLLMSATLGPQDYFCTQAGLEASEIAWVNGHAPWRNGAYQVTINADIDTRYQHRKHHYPQTAAILASFQEPADGPLAAFFPSYQYAEDIAQYLQVLHPEIRLAMQPRGSDLDAQTAFLETALLSADILLLVLGGSFSEGIDILGGRVKRAAVISPALPEVNAMQRARMEALSHLPREIAFRHIYQIPGMTKINQALGRLVRAPEHSAKILLMGKRFTQHSYLALLDPALSPSPAAP